MSVLPDQQPLRQSCVGTMLSEVANAMVRLYREQFGRGPTQACAYWCSSDVLVVKLEGVLTPEERRLVEIDESERVGEIRSTIQRASTPHYRNAVESITGRMVRTLIGGVDAETSGGIAIETFVLHPRGPADAPGSTYDRAVTGPEPSP